MEHNLTLAEAAGAQKSPARFPIAINADDEARVARELEQRNILTGAQATLDNPESRQVLATAAAPWQ